MTTTVTVKACCAQDTEVCVFINEDNRPDGYAFFETLQHNDSREYYIYDNRQIIINERLKLHG